MGHKIANLGKMGKYREIKGEIGSKGGDAPRTPMTIIFGAHTSVDVG
jgi:hypothetical protein